MSTAARLNRNRRYALAFAAAAVAVIVGAVMMLGGVGRRGAEAAPDSTATIRDDAAVPAVAPSGPWAQPATPARHRGWLMAIGYTPSAAEVAAVPGRYGVVVLNQWDRAIAARIKRLDPSIVVLVYQCLSSTRDTDRAATRSGGVLHSAARPEWFATDTAGKRIEWSPYPNHWQMKVWDAGYQSAWIDSVTAELRQGPWDGVLGDNDLVTLRWYSSGLLAGTRNHAQTDTMLRDGLQVLVDRAGPAINALGKRLVVNLSDGRLHPGRWAAHTRYGGGMEENFAYFADSDQYVSAGWGADGWLTQSDETRTPGLTLTVTRAAGDAAAWRYGYASALVRGDDDTFWTAAEPGEYVRAVTIPEQSWPVGAASAPVHLANGAWVRDLTSIWVAVNPTDRAVEVTPPAGLRTGDAAPVSGAQRLGPHSALVLRR